MFDGKDVKCFVCRREMGTSDASDPTTVHAVDGGLIFRAYGNYGSTVFDPVPDDGFLEIGICDACIKERQHHVIRVCDIKTVTTGKSVPFKCDVP